MTACILEACWAPGGGGWHQQGRQTAARQLLTQVYGWFSEGFATADLQETGALLDEIS